MSNELAIPNSNKALREIQKAEKTLQELSKVLNDSELDSLCEVSDLLNTAKLKIGKIRGWF